MKRILYTGLDPSNYVVEGYITHCPLIQTVPRPFHNNAIQQALAQFSLYSHVILTSKTPIRILKDYLHQFGYSLEIWKSKKTFAVGRATAKRLAEEGIEPFCIAKEETAEGVVAQLESFLFENCYFFWPHAAGARRVIPEFFEQRSARLQACIFYDTLPLRPEILPKLEDFNEIVFTSPSTVEAFLAVFSELPRDKVLTPIGPVTAAYLKQVKSLSTII